jgi:hypothetical protein
MLCGNSASGIDDLEEFQPRPKDEATDGHGQKRTFAAWHTGPQIHFDSAQAPPFWPWPKRYDLQTFVFIRGYFSVHVTPGFC